MILLRQVELAHETTRMLVWVDSRLKLKPGTKVTGRDGYKWRVVHKYKMLVHPDAIDKDWEVGGLTPQERIHP